MSNSLASRRPLVVGLGQHLALGLLDEDLERDLLVRPLAEALVEDGVELEDVARPLAPQLGVELGHEHPGADLVEEVGCGERVDDVVVDVALDVDLGVVAVDERRVGLLEVREPLAQRVDLRVDRLVGDGGARDLDRAASS